ncbi:hypothetical protein HJC23_004803 [Cyclotella cryptica]|uniref:Uncharacterized protein n=1 Tax=Cyclotella cryptica TaxID=29204 RepID=A0ABD3PXH0_9STRA
MYEEHLHVVDDDDDDDDDDSTEEWLPVGMSVVTKQSLNPEIRDANTTNNDTLDQESTKDLNATIDTIDKFEPNTIDANAQQKSKRLDKTKNQATSPDVIANEEDLQERLDGIDNLLENLQEEEWANKEKEEEQGSRTEKDKEESTDA